MVHGMQQNSHESAQVLSSRTGITQNFKSLMQSLVIRKKLESILFYRSYGEEISRENPQKSKKIQKQYRETKRK